MECDYYVVEISLNVLIMDIHLHCQFDKGEQHGFLLRIVGHAVCEEVEL